MVETSGSDDYETAFSIENRATNEKTVVDRYTKSLGYEAPEDISTQDVIDLYKRDQIVHRRIHKELADIFGKKPEINADDEELERDIRELLFDRGLYYKLREASKASFIDGVSLVYLNLDDEADITSSPRSIRDIEKIGVIYKKDINAPIIEKDINDPDYNEVVGWKINNYEIHADRLVHVVFDTIYNEPSGIPKILPEFDYHIMRKSILEDGVKAFHQNAAGLKLFTPGEDANDKDIKWLKKNVKNLRGASGEMTAPPGTSVDHPAPKIADPTPYIDPIMEQGTTMPYQILTGTQAGAVTGSETNLRLYYKEIQNTRENTIDKWIKKVINILQEGGYLDEGDINLNWGDVLEKDEEQKANIFYRKASGVTDLFELGLINEEEARKKMGFEASATEVEKEEHDHDDSSLYIRTETKDVDLEDDDKLWEELSDDEVDTLKDELGFADDWKLINRYEAKMLEYLVDLEEAWIDRLEEAFAEVEGDDRSLLDKLLRRERKVDFSAEFTNVEELVAVVAEISGLEEAHLRDILQDLHREAYLLGYNSVAELHNAPLKTEISGYALQWVENNATLRSQFKTDDYNNAIRQRLLTDIRKGRTMDDLERHLSSELEGYRHNVETLARTEINNAVNNGRISSFRDLGMRKGTILAVDDERTCDECMELDGREFHLDDLRDLIPVHPNCRCQVVASKDFRGVNL